MDETRSETGGEPRTTLPSGLRGWMTFVGVMTLLFGIVQVVTILGVIQGVLLIIAGIAILGASKALERIESVEPNLEPFFVKLRRFVLLTGFGYLASLLFLPGLIAAIAIPNLLNAIDRGKQKRTMADIRSIGTAVETFAVANGRYPANVETSTPVAGNTEMNLEQWLSPDFIRQPPAVDGWGHPLVYQSDSEGSSYRLMSYGKDGVLSPRSSGRTTDFDCDIIFEVGGFVAWPEGIQT